MRRERRKKEYMNSECYNRFRVKDDPPPPNTTCSTLSCCVACQTLKSEV